MSLDLRDLVLCAAIACAATITLGVISLEREIRLAGDGTASRGSAVVAKSAEPKPIRLEPVIVTAQPPSPAVALVQSDKATR